MSKEKATECRDSESACEIIESAIDEMELLTRAFDLINDICRPQAAAADTSELSEERIVLN